MSQEAVERMLGRLLTDERFRMVASGSLEAACRQEGYALSAVELQLLARLEIAQLRTLAGGLEPGLRRAVGAG